MMDRPMAMSDIQRIRPAQSIREIVFGGPDRFVQSHAAGQMRRYSRGQGASRTVCIPGFYARGAETAHLAPGEKHIFRRCTRKVPALDENRLCALSCNRQAASRPAVVLPDWYTPQCTNTPDGEPLRGS